MGIPKFFRWAAERYPTIITPFKESPPPIDNLYVDVNGIIHNCSHPNDVDATRKSLSDKEMVHAMFAYLEKIFQAVQPRKYFVMAVDGVAPRAKMNQQRQRRYRAGYELMMAREEALSMGDEVPDEADVFDSNCITPGTDFMCRVGQHFQYFVTMKLHQDSAWRNCTVILSGHDDPGEGEHKIADFIRRRKMQPDYNPNETHCLYGLDADLMMLSLATHEPHFVLLREVVTFGGPPKDARMRGGRAMADEAAGVKEDTSLVKQEEFVLLHIGMFREYLDIDFRQGETFPNYNLERSLDDFVFLCFFVGNDFLPALPTLAIDEGAMDTLIEVYREVCLRKGLFLSTLGKPNWEIIEKVLGTLGQGELAALQARQQLEKDREKRERRRNLDYETPHLLAEPIVSIADFKEKWYRNKHRFEAGWQPRGPELGALRESYVEGLLWVIEYYFQGPPSWKWYYPHHYAPMASDLVNLPSIASRVHFDRSEPFLPHQQLLAVLPPMSYRLLPKAYWELLRSPNSALADYFPHTLVIDREGAKAPWEGIVLVPFLDEKSLLEAYEAVQSQVSEADRMSNTLGSAILFKTNHQMEPYDVSSTMFQPLNNVQVQRVTFRFPEMKSRFVPKLCDGVAINAEGIEGFSSLHSKLSLLQPSFEVGVVNLFGRPTRRSSLLLRMESLDGIHLFREGQEEPSVYAESFSHLIDHEVLVKYPHFKRARVVSLTDGHGRLSAKWDNNGNFSGIEHKRFTARDDIAAFFRECETHALGLKAKCGIVLPHGVSVIVGVFHVIGMRMSKNGNLALQYSKKETPYPLQIITELNRVNLIPDARYVERSRRAGDFEIGARVVYIGPSPKGCAVDTFGATGYVNEKHEDGTNSITLNIYRKPLAVPVELTSYSSRDDWMALHDVARMLHVSAASVSQLCSSILLPPMFGSKELGLCLKFTGKELARIGYAKLVQTQYNPWYVGRANVFEHLIDEGDRDENSYLVEEKGGRDRDQRGQFHRGSHISASGKGTWYFSKAAVDLITQYVKKFDPLVARLESGMGNTRSLDPASFMTGPWAALKVEDVLKDIAEWIQGTGIYEVPMCKATDDCAPAPLVGQLETFLEQLAQRETFPMRLRRVPIRMLHFPACRAPEGYVISIPVPVKDQRFAIGSRVVNCRSMGVVPFGAQGTVVRVLGTGNTAEIVFDETFVEGGRLGGRLKTNRGALCRLNSLLVVPPIVDGSTSQALEAAGDLVPPTPSPGQPPVFAPGTPVLPSSPPGFNIAAWAKQRGLVASKAASEEAASADAQLAAPQQSRAASGPSERVRNKDPPLSMGQEEASFVLTPQITGSADTPAAPREALQRQGSVSVSGGSKGVSIAELATRMAALATGTSPAALRFPIAPPGGEKPQQNSLDVSAMVPRPRSTGSQQKPASEQREILKRDSSSARSALPPSSQEPSAEPQPPPAPKLTASALKDVFRSMVEAKLARHLKK